ncbi:MAG: hypothetical protein KDA42_18325, partial [Planctomycetales bacterium]|nr:hypothetical protein [Planctomycetales bacterium]
MQEAIRPSNKQKIPIDLNRVPTEATDHPATSETHPLPRMPRDSAVDSVLAKLLFHRYNSGFSAANDRA